MTRMDRWVSITLAVVLAASLLAGLIDSIPSWFWHPLGTCTGRWCNGYQFWSGIAGSFASDIGTYAAILAAGAAWWHHHNCHEPGCLRLQWHPHPETGHPVCKRHHPDHPSDTLPHTLPNDR